MGSQVNLSFLFRLSYLYLVAVACAVPDDQFRVPGYPQWYGYGPGYPLARSFTYQHEAAARHLVSFASFQRVTGEFKADSTQVPAHTVTGSAAFYQNPFTGSDTKYKVKVAGVEGGTEFVLMLQTDCVKTNHIGVVSGTL